MTRRSSVAWLLWLAGSLAACDGGGMSAGDAGTDLAMADLSHGDLAGNDLSQTDAASAGDMADSGSCVFTLSNAVGTNATIADLVFPLMIAPGKGLSCNDATGPTTCSVSPNGSTGDVTWTVFAGLGSLVPPVSVPFISNIAVQPDTAIMVYVEGSKRWTAQPGGSFTLDAQSGHSASLHFTVHLQPDPNGAAGATGTFDVSAVCTAIDFRP